MELKILHPLVAEWLTQNGFTFEHEVKLPEYGRADFIATETNGNKLVIECKVEMFRKSRPSILQLLGYCHQLGEDISGAMAVPDTYVNNHAIELCKYYGVDLLLVSGYDYQCGLSTVEYRNKTAFIFSELVELWQTSGTQYPEYWVLFDLFLNVVWGTTGKRSIGGLHQINNLTLEEYVLALIAAKVLIELHTYRCSQGKAELAEDIEDIQPVLNMARPEVQKLLSKKPSRLQNTSQTRIVKS